MSKKKRQSATAKPPAVDSALRKFYELGLRVVEEDNKNPRKGKRSWGVVIDIANELNVKRDHVEKARNFVNMYDESEFEKLCALRRPDGTALSPKHVITLMSVKHKARRRSLQRKTAEEGWGVRRLEREKRKLQGTKSRGGRRPRRPEAVDDALMQIIKMADHWERWYEQFEDEETKGGSLLKQLTKAVRDQLVATTDEITTLRETVQRRLKRTTT